MPANLKAPKKPCALREKVWINSAFIVRPVLCALLSVSYSRRRRECCPLQHCRGWEQILRAHAVVSSCVRRLHDKGWQEGNTGSDAGEMERGSRMYAHVCSKGDSRLFQKLAGSFRTPFNFVWFQWGSDLLNFMSNTSTKMCCGLPAVKWRPAQCGPFLPSLCFPLI